MTHDRASEGDNKQHATGIASLWWLGVWTVAGGTDIGWTAVHGGPLFLTRTESSTYYIAAALSWAGVLLFASALGGWARTLGPENRVQSARVAAGVAAVTSGALAYATFEGRQVVAYRVPLTLASAVITGAIVLLLFRRIRPTPFYRLALAGGACVALTLNANLLARLYPAFHLGLVIAAVCMAGIAASLVEWRRPGILLFLSLLITASAGFAAHRLTQMDNARFVAEHHSSLVGRVVTALPRQDIHAEVRNAATPSEPQSRAIANQSGPDLAGVDVLLITVDALRADILGTPLVPHMNALAAESAVFAHAYTPTPHTSYALSSLLTGKFLRPVLALSQTAGDHQSLPGVLRQYGYRTAAFYPPAIFFVDRARFGALAERGFDFEYRKTMFAPAAARARQLARYFDELEGDHPTLSWVHLFEPHEPYDPPEAFRRGESARERYDGEVAAADAAIGELIAVFRAGHPDGTIIVSADHGEEFADHGGYHHGTTLYDEQVAIPLIWHSPGLAPRVVQTPVELVDITTTLLSAMGIPRDVRMRGDDLGALLLVGDTAVQDTHYAFADVGDERMVMDGRYKAICTGSVCRVFDLHEDPHEQRNIAEQVPDVLARLRRILRAFTESIPRVEAMALGNDSAEDAGGWPAALAAAELGQGRGEDLVPLLGSERAEVRTAAVRQVGELGYEPALRATERLVDDPDPVVSAEALLAAARLLSESALESLSSSPREGFQWEENRYRRRVAVFLAERGGFPDMGTLDAILDDPAESEDHKRRAVAALMEASEPGVPADIQQEATHLLIAALDDVNLRVTAATALGAFDSRLAAEELTSRLSEERYLAARAAEAAALVRLDPEAALPLIQYWLGTPEPLPRGVAMLAELGEARVPGPPGWTCVDRNDGRQEGRPSGRPSGGPERCTEGWTPTEHATLGPGGVSTAALRLVFRTEGRGVLHLDGQAIAIHGEETSLPIPPGRPLQWQVRLVGDIRVIAYVLVVAREELPAPAPDPWQEEPVLPDQ